MESIKIYDNLSKNDNYNQTAISFESLINETSKCIDKIKDMKAS